MEPREGEGVKTHTAYEAQNFSLESLESRIPSMLPKSYQEKERKEEIQGEDENLAS